MEEEYSKINNAKQKSSLGKYLIIILIVLCIVAGYIYKIITWEPKPDLISEKIIYSRVANSLDKDINDVTDEDFTKIFKLSIGNKLEFEIIELSDIRKLEKLTNLQNLTLRCIRFSQKDIPSWIKMLADLKIINLSDRFNIDLSPIEKLLNLQTLNLIGSHIDSIKPLKNLKNLQDINLAGTNVTNLRPLSGLLNLRSLNLGSTQISNIEPLKKITNLQTLNLSNTQINELKPLYGLKNLNTLNIRDCKNITDKQVEDLQKALPNLTIDR